MSRASKSALSGYQTPAEEREAAEMRSVALRQPHRQGNDSVRAGEPLWEACERLRLREELYMAGQHYGEVSRNYKVTIDIAAPPSRDAGTVPPEDQIEARAKLAKDRYWAAINTLRSAHPMAQGVIERVCYDLRPLNPHEENPFRKGLYSLSVHFGILKLGINEERDTRG